MQKKILFFLLILVLFQAVNNIIVVSHDQPMPVYDRASHILEGHRIFNDFKWIRTLGLKGAYRYFYNNVGGRYYPPFFYLVSAIHYNFVDFCFDSAAYVNIVFLFILIFSIYGIGKVLYDSKVGLLAAFIVSMFPGVFAFSRVGFLDFPLTAMVALGIFILLLTEGFKNRTYSLLLGLVLGLGMLTKWSFFVYISGPMAYAFFISLRNRGGYKSRLLNMFFILFTALAVCVPWYLPNASLIIKRLSIASTFPLVARHYLFYVHSFYLYQVYPFLSFIFVVSFYKHITRRRDWVTILWVLVPFLMFTILPNRDVRYTIPILPGVALIIARGVYEYRKPTLVLLSLFLILQFFLLSYVPYSIFNSIEFKTNPLGVNFNYADYTKKGPLFETGLLFPREEGAVQRKRAYEMVNFLKKHINTKDNDGDYQVLVFFNKGDIYYGLQFVVEEQNLPISINLFTHLDPIKFSTTDLNLDLKILNSDFLITKSGYQGLDSPIAKEVFRNLTEGFEKNKDKFIHIGTFQYDDLSEIYLYKKK